METGAQVDLGTSPPRVTVPRRYNAAYDFVEKNVVQGRGANVAVIDRDGEHTYAELNERMNRAGHALRGLGVGLETRVMMAMVDTAAFPAVFFGAVKIGAVPIPVNILWTADDLRYALADSRAKVLVLSAELLDRFKPALGAQPFLEHVTIVGGDRTDGHARWEALVDGVPSTLAAAPTCADDIGCWLYSSGSTGTPKGVMHAQSDFITTAALYGQAILGIREDDVVFSAAKLFFAYGLGNAMTFPFSVGATAVLLDGRPTPQSVMQIMERHQPTIYYGVPTLYAAILAEPSHSSATGSKRLRRCVSAGEALPEELGRRWEERFGAEILDGLGSTELLHIFLSARPGAVRYGTTGQPVPGYQMRVVDEAGEPLPPGEIGELLVRGPTSAVGYWNQRDKSRGTFRGEWTATGDKYTADEDGYFTYCGRADDMMKVSGQWVSPFEVESALAAHPAVLEAAVIGREDDDGLLKPMAFVVLAHAGDDGHGLHDELRRFVKERIAPWKYPRWVELVEDLPKTATGKIQRFKLRARYANGASSAT